MIPPRPTKPGLSDRLRPLRIGQKMADVGQQVVKAPVRDDLFSEIVNPL